MADTHENEITRLLVNYLASALDFTESIIYVLNRLLAKIHESFRKFPRESLIETLDAMSKLRNIYTVFWLHPLALLPDKDLDEKLFIREYNSHGAYVYYHWDAIHTYGISMLMAFAGHYALAYSLLRTCVESLVWGLFYDAITRPEYREKISSAKGISLIEKSKQYRNLADFLQDLDNIIRDEEYSVDFEVSASIFDILEEYGIEPIANVKAIINQFKDWDLLSSEETQELHRVYKEKLSRFVHRIIPKYTDVGVRVDSEHADLACIRYLARDSKSYKDKLDRNILAQVIDSCIRLKWTQIEEVLRNLM